MENIKVLKKHENTCIRYYTKGSAGFDIQCLTDYILQPNIPTLIDTGLYLAIGNGLTGFIMGRSSLALMGVMCFNGVVDSDYTGEIRVILLNLGTEPIFLKAFSRIAQMVLLKYYVGVFNENETLQDRVGGFGSTGI